MLKRYKRKRTLRCNNREQVQLAHKHNATNRSTGREQHNRDQPKSVLLLKLQHSLHQKAANTTTQYSLHAGRQMVPSFTAVSVPQSMTAPLGGPTTKTPFGIPMVPAHKTKKN